MISYRFLISQGEWAENARGFNSYSFVLTHYLPGLSLLITWRLIGPKCAYNPIKPFKSPKELSFNTLKSIASIAG